MKSSKKKKEKRHLLSNDDVCLPDMDSAEDNIKSNKKHKKSKKLKRHSDEIDDSLCDINSADEHRKKHKKSKKHKQHLDETLDLSDTASEHKKKHKKSKKRKRHSDEENEISYIEDSVDELTKKTKKSKKHRRNSNEEAETPNMESLDEHRKSKKHKKHSNEEAETPNMESLDEHRKSKKHKKHSYEEAESPNMESLDEHRKSKKHRKYSNEEAESPNMESLDEQRKSKKHRKYSNEEAESPNMESLDEHRKSKKHKNHSNEEAETPNMESLDEHRKSKKHKRHSNEEAESPNMESLDEHRKKHKKSKKRKQHSNEDTGGDGENMIGSSNGIFHSLSDNFNPSESLNSENQDTLTSCRDETCSDDAIDAGENQNTSSVPDLVTKQTSLDSVLDPDSITKQPSFRNSKKKRQSDLSSDILSTLLLTDDEAAIIHNGKVSNGKSSKVYQEMGIQLRVGRWIQEEDKILLDNFEAIKAEYGLEMDNDFLLQLLFEQFLASSTEERIRVRQFRKTSDFYVKLAGNLRRLPESVMDRARKILPAWKVGPFTPEEEKTLLEQHEKHGNQWTIIGFHMNRSRNSVLDHYQIIKDENRKRGTWTEKEVDDLIAAISEVMETDDLLSLPHTQLPWTKIASKMNHRSAKQCRNLWVYRLRPLLAQGTLGMQKIQVDKVTLVKEIYNLDVLLESEINWEELLERIPNGGTPQNLANQWIRLKALISGGENMSFTEVREELASLYFEL